MNTTTLLQSFDQHIAPLFAMNAGFTIRGIGFQQFYGTGVYCNKHSDVSIHLRMDATIQEEIRKGMKAYFKPLLRPDESMLCILSCYNTRIRLSLRFDDSRNDAFQYNPYLNQEMLIALQVLRERSAQLNP